MEPQSRDSCTPAIEEGLAEKPDSNAVRELGSSGKRSLSCRRRWNGNLAPGETRTALGLARGGLRGVRSLDPRLIAALKAGSSTYVQIMDRMDISPSDTEETRAMGHQLEILGDQVAPGMALDTLKLIEAWRNDAQIRGAAPKSCYIYYRTLHRWARWLDDQGLAFEDVDRNVIRD